MPPTADPAASDPRLKAERISEIIAEFSEIFAFARRRWARLAEEIHPDLKGPAVIMLQFIMRKGPITATGIGQMLEMDKALVSRQIAKLRELGLVEAEPAAEDRRVMLLTGSAQARSIVDRIREQWAHTYHERFAGWGVDELTELMEALHRFNASAEEVRADELAARCTRGHAAPNAALHTGAIRVGGADPDRDPASH
ncbi:MarR family winged helix-turn-helix transcriptional regulator [Leucobacter allii]|uniref:MarR family winged helix-turn-helix transcriptional regulator n=1 Tax=Leucobacter allii TaxID=2932247 RepID=UPI001FD156C0|nr:MarR family winged helix-turn-helix transcriptional regulator [Leucobacter allii]UOR02218.1 MarR family winged helix-turn-helix transcriptional regulator [Leucobacter allii]